MALETVFAQITHEAPFASKKETSMLPVCCLCGLIRDELRASLDRERWVTRRAYLKTHGVNPTDCVLAHTYCPSCLTQVMEATRKHELEADKERLHGDPSPCLNDTVPRGGSG